MIYDVVVIGGGPAGSATALRLAQLGKRVALCERGIDDTSLTRSPRLRFGESLAAAALTLLDVLSVRELALATGCIAARGTTISWAETTRYEHHPTGTMLVDRAVFDAALFRAASTRDRVTTFHPARVVRATRGRGASDQAEGQTWEVLLDDGRCLHSTLLVEATGRTHVLPRRRRALGERTLAMFAYFRDGLGVPDGDTLIESGEDAWYWGARLPGGELNAMVFVDPGKSRKYDDLICASSLLAPALREARRARGPFVREATAYVDDLAIGEGFLKVGDAALALDPLSSQGLEMAVGTALHAAIVLNTMLERPASAILAADFYRSRLQSSAAFHSRAAADFYARQAAVRSAAFWRRRAAAAAPSLTAHLPPAPESWVAPSCSLRFVSVPVATEAYVVPKEGVELAGERYAFVDKDLAVAPLIRALGGPRRGIDVVRVWSHEMQPERALRVLLWACSKGIIEQVGPPCASDEPRRMAP